MGPSGAASRGIQLRQLLQRQRFASPPPLPGTTTQEAGGDFVPKASVARGRADLLRAVYTSSTTKPGGVPRSVLYNLEVIHCFSQIFIYQ